MTKLISNQLKFIRAAGEITIKSSDNGLEIYSLDGTTGASFLIGTLNVQGNQITLLSTNAGTPTQDAFLKVERGVNTDSEIRWNETTDDWQAGLSGSLLSIARRVRVDITNANLSSGVYTFNHNIGKYPIIQILDNSLNLILMNITHVTVNQCTINFSNVISGTLTGTWQAIAIG